MAITSALFGTLSNATHDVNFYTSELIKLNAIMESNTAKLAAHQKLESKFYAAHDKAMYNDNELHKGSFTVHKNNENEQIADEYAHLAVRKYDKAVLDELAEKDEMYQQITLVCQTRLEQSKAYVQNLKPEVKTAAADTDTLSGT